MKALEPKDTAPEPAPKSTEKTPKADPIPADLKPYYTTEKPAAQRAVNIAGGIIIGLIIVALLFFAGRWVVDKVSGDDKPASSTSKEDKDSGSSSSDDSDDDAQSGSNGTGSTGSTGQSGTSGSGNTQTPPAAPPAAGDSSELPNVGAGDTILLFVVAVLGGALAHSVLTARKRADQ